MHHPSSPEMTKLIGQVYSAALDTSAWPDFIASLAASLNSHAGLIYANDFSARSVQLGLSGEPLSAAHGFEASALDSFARYYGARNVWLEDSRLHHEGAVVTGSMLYPDRQLKRTEYWTDWLRPQDIFHTAAVIVEKREERSVNLALVRSERAGAYSADELAVLHDLKPHLQAGMALHRRLSRLEMLSASATAVLEGLPFGVALFDAQARLIYASSKAIEMSGRTGLLKLREGGPVSCPNAADDAALQRLVRDACRTGCAEVGGAGGALSLGRPAAKQLRLSVTPLPAGSGAFGSSAASAMFFSGGEAVIGPLTTALGSVYGMTRAEARLTEALTNGRSLSEHAEASHVSINTVRSQLKVAMAKVGARRQAELVSLVLAGPAVLRWPERNTGLPNA